MGQLLNTASNTIKVGRETTLGTAVTPTENLKHTGFTADIAYGFEGNNSFTGSRAKGGSSMVSKIGALSYPFEADNRNLGWVLAGFFGSEVLTPLSTGAYKHEFSMLDASALPSFTFETCRGGAYHYTNSGAVCDKLSLSVSPKSKITGSADYVFLNQVAKATPTSLAVAATRPFIYGDSKAGSFKINDSAMGEVKSISFSGSNGVYQEDFRLNNAGSLATIPVGAHEFTGSMVVAFNADSKFLEDYLPTSTTFDLKFVLDSGVTIGTTDTIKMEVHIPTAQISNLKLDSGDFIYYSIDFSSVGSGATISIVNDRATKYLA